MSRTALNMKKLIEKKYYPDKEIAMVKLDLLMLASRITDEEYTDLMLLASDMYDVPPDVPPTK